MIPYAGHDPKEGEHWTRYAHPKRLPAPANVLELIHAGQRDGLTLREIARKHWILLRQVRAAVNEWLASKGDE